MTLRHFLFGFFLFCCSFASYAQAGRYAPFVVDSGAVTATLKVKDSPLEDKFAAVFTKHKLNASSPADWLELLGNIAGMQETDLWVANEITFESTEQTIELSAINFDNLEQMVKTLRLTIATPEKLEDFLKENERLLQKKK